MSNIINTGASDFATGSLDTTTTLVNGVSPHSATHVNGISSAVVQIEAVLGSAVTLKGTQPDLATRLGVALGSDGILKLSTDAAVTGPLSVSKGGTGRVTLTTNRALVGNGTGLVSMLTGLTYHGPTSTATGSTFAHEGVVTISSNQPLSGMHCYTDFTLNAGIVLTPAANSGRLIIVASNSITLNGNIAATGTGGTGGLGGAGAVNNLGQPGGPGTTNGGGSGGSASAGGGGLGGSTPGTLGGTAGRAGSITGAQAPLLDSFLVGMSHPFAIQGGAGGGGGGADAGANAGGVGGAGGGSVILIAPTVTIGASSVITTSGSNGVGGAVNSGGGGGGSAGNLYVFTGTYTDNGLTFTATAGTAGGGAGTGGSGAAGRAGVKQIFIYA